MTTVALFLCIYAAGRWGVAPLRDWARAGSVVVVLTVLGEAVRRERVLLTEAIIPDRAYYLLSAVGVAFNLVFLVLAWRLGGSARRAADRTQELAARTIELESEREENARRAVIDERLRIARELHDVVAHHVSVMGIQAAATRRVADRQPERVEPGLETIEEASRLAIMELQRLLGFLRQGPEPEPGGGRGSDAVLPGLASLDVLRRQLADAGLALSIRGGGEVRALPPAIDVSAYRIIQESLTNVLKHSSADEARVDIVLLAGIKVVASGAALLSPKVTRRVIAAVAARAPRRAAPPELEGLTEREHQVLLAMGRGLSNAEVAVHLTIGEATVKTHVSNVLMKLGLRDRVQAVVFTHVNGLLD